MCKPTSRQWSSECPISSHTEITSLYASSFFQEHGTRHGMTFPTPQKAVLPSNGPKIVVSTETLDMSASEGTLQWTLSRGSENSSSLYGIVEESQMENDGVMNNREACAVYNSGTGCSWVLINNTTLSWLTMHWLCSSCSLTRSVSFESDTGRLTVCADAALKVVTFTVDSRLVHTIPIPYTGQIRLGATLWRSANIQIVPPGQ